jgi:hypothetical protein
LLSRDLYIETFLRNLKSQKERQVKKMTRHAGKSNGSPNGNPNQNSNGKTMHHVEIGIKKPSKSQVLAARKMTLKDRFLNAIFGDGHKMVVLVPGESVGTISITEMEVHELHQE